MFQRQYHAGVKLIWNLYEYMPIEIFTKKNLLSQIYDFVHKLSNSDIDIYKYIPNRNNGKIL